MNNSQITVDAKGLRCPMPLLKLKLALHQAQAGQVLCLLVDDPQSHKDIARWLEQAPHQLLQQSAEQGNQLWIQVHDV